MLKYGCKATAWASDLQVCPPLEWAGPTRQQFFDHHEDANDAAEWPQRRDELDHLFIRTMNKTDRSIMKVLNNLKLLDEEPVLREELKSMFDGRGVSLSNLQLLCYESDLFLRKLIWHYSLMGFHSAWRPSLPKMLPSARESNSCRNALQMQYVPKML